MNAWSASGISQQRRMVVMLMVVLGYCFHGLMFVSDTNVKDRSIKNEFTRLHPILRLGISTLVFLDKDLLLTDASRHPDDYKKMGLKTKANSLHYLQGSGYAHAVDVRTTQRGIIRNFLVKIYFQLMGFNTLRHVGTADHLHISLSSHDLPGRR